MSDNNTFDFLPAQTKRASEVIYDQIYNRIIDGTLKTGDKLPSERDLAAQFHRGRQSVREALRMLQQDGLIEINLGNKGGAYVLGYSLVNATDPLNRLLDIGVISPKEVAEFKSFNEIGLALLAIENRTDSDLDELAEVLEKFKASIPDRDAFSNCDHEFHRALARASHNQLCILINDTVDTIYNSNFWANKSHLAYDEYLKLADSIYKNHYAMYEALINRDSETIKECITSNTNQILNN